jgi:hypothetical protein
MKAIEELLKTLNEKENEVGLSINQKETKCSEINAKISNLSRNKNVKMGQHDFERVQTPSSIVSNK